MMSLKPLSIRSALPILFALAGALIVLCALLSLAAAMLPYPDPTPELLAEQQADLQTYRSILFTGLGVFVAGAAVSLVRFIVWFQRR